MIFVGIDVSKKKHDICIIDSDGTILEEHLTIENSKFGFHTLRETILKQDEGSIKSKIKIALEDTGHYSFNLLSFLRNEKYSVFSYNPILIKEFSKSTTLRKTKTDKKDAKLIARKLMSDSRAERFFPDESLTDLKFLTRNRSRLGKYRSESKVQYVRLVDLMFPELSHYVTSLHHNYIFALLKKYPSPKALGKSHLSTLISTLSKASQGKIGQKEAEEIRYLAKNSIGQVSTILELEMIQAIEIIEFYTVKIKAVDKQIDVLMRQLNSPITSIPGISNRLGSVILAEVRNINNFKNPAQLLAFSGMEPSVNQSGSHDGKGKMVKRGSSSLRWALHQAARLVAIHSPLFRNYMQKKIREGKHYNVALSHVAKKLVRIIFHLLKNNVTYVEKV
ncbi:IS110 family transposase [Desemzia sp. FAM 23989]|uniref:IS110 family transposase n=1 Tax=Desemzia sp. FAM 23989 TaxID=3259523 RepID=UPI0038889193